MTENTSNDSQRIKKNFISNQIHYLNQKTPYNDRWENTLYGLDYLLPGYMTTKIAYIDKVTDCIEIVDVHILGVAKLSPSLVHPCSILSQGSVLVGILTLAHWFVTCLPFSTNHLR